MHLSRALVDHPIVSDDTLLVSDVVGHLGQYLPDVVNAYPQGYFIGLVRHSALLARDHFGLDDLAAIRLFVRLRWEIAAGYYHHPHIAQVLSDRSLTGIQRFEALSTPETEHLWLEATEYDGETYWRGRLSHGFGDVDDLDDGAAT